MRVTIDAGENRIVTGIDVAIAAGRPAARMRPVVNREPRMGKDRPAPGRR